MVSLAELKQKLQPIKELSHLTSEVDIGGNCTISLRLLHPDEETNAMLWAREILEEYDDEKGNDMVIAQYYDRFRRETLAKSIFAINGEKLGPTVETGKTLPGGVPERIQTSLAMRDEIATWGRALIERVFAKYGELIVDSETIARDAIKLEPLDLDEEIERIKAVLEDLQRQKDEQDQTALEFRNKHIGAAQSTSQIIGDQMKVAAGVPNREQEPAPTQTQYEAPPVQRSQTSQPAPTQNQYAAPPMQRAQPNQGVEYAAPPVQRQQHPQYEEDNRAYVPARRPTQPEQDWSDSSFVNPSDESAMQEEMRRETERQLRLRQKRAQMQQASVAPLPQRRPPHAGAAHVSQHTPQAEERPLSEPANGGDYSMRQDVTIGQRHHRGNKKLDSSMLNQSSNRGVTNPKFKPRKKR
jgi:hypothetical protein